MTGDTRKKLTTHNPWGHFIHMGKYLFRIEVLFTLLLSGNCVSLFAGSEILTDPDELHAVPTVLKSLRGFTVTEDELYLFQERSDEYVQMPFRPEAKTRVDRFGKYLDSVRLNVGKTKYPGEWRGMLWSDEDGRRKVFWDASMMQLVQFMNEGNKIIQEVTVPADRLKPPSDRMGEPTAKETSKYRAKFKSVYRKIFGVRYTGLTPLPKGWMSGDKVAYLVSTKIPEFPITVLGCLPEDPVACTMERFCFLENGPNIKPESIRGVGVLPSKKFVLIGDAERHRVHIYKWESCFNSRYVKSLELPKMIQKLSSLQVDAKERLWISTEMWENKFDSNLYYWDAGTWLK